MIDTDPIALYNKTLAYTRKEFYTYDDKEMQSVKEAAPLLKFALQKLTLQVQAENVETILSIGAMVGAQLVIISRTRAQFLTTCGSTAKLYPVSQHTLNSCFKHGKNVLHVHKDHMMDVVICDYWSRYDGALMEGSAIGGMYVRQKSGEYKHLKTANSIIHKLFEHGYIAVKGRIPLAANPEKFGMHDIEELTRMLNFCTNENMRGVWMRQVAAQFNRTIRDYRWPTRSELELKVKRFIRR